MTDAADYGAKFTAAVAALYPAPEWGTPEVDVRHGYVHCVLHGQPGESLGAVEEVEVRVRLRRYLPHQAVVQPAPRRVSEDGMQVLSDFTDHIYGRRPPDSPVVNQLVSDGLLVFRPDVGLYVLTPRGKVARDTGMMHP